MDFMNLNQSAHGDREFGFIGSRMRLNRKVVVGHWQDPDVQCQPGHLDARRLRLARLAGRARRPLRRQHARSGGHRGRQGRGPDPLGLRRQRLRRGRPGGQRAAGLRRRDRPPGGRIRRQLHAWPPRCEKGGSQHAALREAARIELGMRAFLKAGDFKAFTTTFEDLHGLAQLPGLAVQRLMARRLRLRRRRRLEDLRPGARHEGDGRRPGGRHLLHGRLHLPPGSQPG